MQSRTTRRAKGAFFTPPALVAFVVETALEKRFAGGEVLWHADGYPLLRILDPSAGDGRFLLEAARSLALRGRAENLVVDERLIRKHCLVAIERDPAYAEITRKALGDAEVHEEEALLSNVVADGSIDVVLGNPPYLRSIALGDVDAELRDQLRNRYFATSHGEWDVYAAFLEQGIRWLAPAGVLGMVVPSRWWTAKWAGPLRGFLSETKALSSLVDFGDAQIFSDATVYASVCIAGGLTQENVAIARLRAGQWQLGQVAQEHLLGEEPWDLAIGTAREFVKQLRRRGTCLGEMARIAKGTGTNADSVFLVASAEQGVEPELLHRVLRGRDVLAFGSPPSWPRLLVPYDAAGTLISPATLAAQYPKAHAYLCGHRTVLEARERGRFAGDGFYCFGRPQNLAFLQAKQTKVVVPDVTRDGRAMLDAEGTMVLDSAYAIRLFDKAPICHETLCGVLSSRVVRLWLQSQGVPLRGGYTRMKTAYLSALPMPAPSKATKRVGELVLEGASLDEVDEQVRRAYGLPRSLWNDG
tara:strand:+ start:82120 stop:83703 length:1584 start_codon:yes stop_codon:yes gene_type:complete